jgi:hypothetical protein
MTPEKKKAQTAGLKRGGSRNPAKLTEFERAFCLHYCGAALGVGSRAAQLAGYNGSAPANFKRYAYEVLQRPRVVAEIERLRAARVERLSITADEVLLDLVAIRDKARLLPATSANLKVELSAVEKIGDHVGVAAFRKQLGLGGPGGGPIEIADAEWLATATDEELDHLERARSIIDRRAGVVSPDSDEGSDTSGA